MMKKVYFKYFELFIYLVASNLKNENFIYIEIF